MNPVPTNPGFKNYAFISYSRKDEREANWLHKALERFRIPSRLPPLPDGAKRPKHLRPVFRDKKDLEYRPDSFVRQIEAELPASRFLIVMCSPNAAQSHPDGRHYVDWEIRQFIQAHGADYARSHILPVVVAGKPGCGIPEQECLPPALLEFGPTFLEHNFPLLKDLPEDRRELREAREDCVIGCVAFLLGVDRKVIRDRYLQAQRERLRLYVLLATGVGLLLAGLAIWAGIERQRADREAQVAIDQRGRAQKSERKAVETLARADFEEASRRLDQHDTSLALAYLGSSLASSPLAASESRLQGLLLQRSWLVEREAFPVVKGEDERIVVAPDMGRVARFRGDSGQPARVTIEPLLQGGRSAVVELPLPVLRGEFTEDGVLLATTVVEHGQSSCRLWRIADGAQTASFPLPDGSSVVRFSRTGRWVVVRNADDSLAVISTSDGRRIGELRLDAGARWGSGLMEPGVILFNDGETAVFAVERAGGKAGEDAQGLGALNSLRVQDRSRFRIHGYRIEGWNEVLRIEQQGAIGSLVCAPDGAYVVYAFSPDTVEDWQIVLHPIDNGIAAWKQKVETAPQFMLLSPDACRLAVIDKGAIALRAVFNAGTCSGRRDIQGTVLRLAFSHDGRRLAFATQSPEVGAIDAETGADAVEPRLLGARLNGLAFSRDDASLRIWGEESVCTYAMQISPLAPRRMESKSRMPVQQVAVSSRGHGLALACSDSKKVGAIELRSLSGESIGQPLDIGEPVNGAAFSPDGIRLAVATGNLLDAKSRGTLLLFDVPAETWNSSMRADVDLPGAGAETDSKAIAPPRRIEIGEGAVRRVRFSPDGRLVLVEIWNHAERGAKVGFYDVGADRMLPAFVEHQGSINDAAFSPDGRYLATAGSDHWVHIWDISARQQIGGGHRMESFPETVAFSPDGSRVVVGGRFLDERGELLVLSRDGVPLWESPRHFMCGVHLVRFAPKGDSIAVAFRDNTVVAYDAATGRPRTAPMRQEYPISGIEFVAATADGRSVLAVACGRYAEKGYLELWDLETGRLQGDRVSHFGSAAGLAVVSDDRLVSWGGMACIVSTVPGRWDGGGHSHADFPALTSALGGWRLNEWRAPEADTGRAADWKTLAGTAPQWVGLLDWLVAPTAERAVEPGSSIKVGDQLAKLVSTGYLSEYKQALDLKPDYAPALAEYWFTAAREIAEATFMVAVEGRSRRERLQRELEWAKYSGDALAEKVFAYPQARRLADFWTGELCAKHPELALSWRERSIFLRHIGRDIEAIDVLRKAQALEPADPKTISQLALLAMQQGDFATAVEAYDGLCTQLERAKSPSLDKVYRTGFTRLNVSTRARGLGNIGPEVDWLLAQLARALSSTQRLSQQDTTQLIELSGKLSDLLVRVPRGSALAVRANDRICELIESKGGKEGLAALKATLRGNSGYARLMSGDWGKALADIDVALASAPDLWPLHLYRAYALAMGGRAEEARTICTKILELDEVFGGQVTQGLVQDFALLRRNGVAIPALEEVRSSALRRILERPGSGLVVALVAPESQSEKLGIQVGDRLLIYDGEPVLDHEWFSWERQVEALNGTVARRTVVLERNGQRLSFEVTAGRLGLGLKAP